MRYKVTPGHIFAYDDNQGIDIFEITLWKRWNYWANIIQTEEQYISILEENRELYDNVLRRYEPINQSGVYAYDLVYSQKHKNHLPFPHHARESLVGQYLSKKLTTLVRNGIVQKVIFPSNHQEKKYLAEELIHNEILSLQDIALLGVNDNDSEWEIQLEIHQFRTDDFVLLGR